jgi:hypothetical protein
MHTTPRQRFKKLATHRTNEVLYRLKVLGNCSNTSFYSYTEDDINKIFRAIEEQVKFVKAKFKKPKTKVKL